MTRLQRYAGVCASLLLAFSALPAAGEPTRSPSQAIDSLHAHLLDVMKNAEALGYDGRSAKLAPVIPEHFDVSFMAEKSVGRFEFAGLLGRSQTAYAHFQLLGLTFGQCLSHVVGNSSPGIKCEPNLPLLHNLWLQG